MYDTNRLLAEWLLNNTTVISYATPTSNPSGENWCAAMVDTGWRYFAASDYLELRLTSEDAADYFTGEGAGWFTVEKRTA